ncbi:hypothetical protein FJY70_03510, partial [candidate division WOR-3 bacterium]|nr:hypothetical protein [candidate division WOR-3 bacterium]
MRGRVKDRSPFPPPFLVGEVFQPRRVTPTVDHPVVSTMSALGLALLLSGALAGLRAGTHRQARVGPTGSYAPEPYAHAPVIRFANGLSIDTRTAPLPRPEERMESGTSWLVHLTGPVQATWPASFRSLGLTPIGYLAYQTVLCRPWRDLPVEECLRLPFVSWLGPFPTQAKLAPGLAGSRTVLDSGLPNRELVLAVWPDADPGAVASAIAAAGGRVHDVTRLSVRFNLGAARLSEVAALAPVAWIQEQSPAREYNSDVQWVMQVGWLPERPDESTGRRVWSHGIRGQGMVVGLFDTGVATDHDMFVDPLFPVNTPGIFPEHRKLLAYKLYRSAAFGDAGGYHGTAVAGTLCGDDSLVGNASRLDGMAPDSRLYFVDNGNAFGLYVFDADLTALLDSVRLSNGLSERVVQVSGSFGTELNLGSYQLEEASLDAVCWNDKEFLVVWAAGNRGGSTYNIGHPSGAKNALTLGACGNGMRSNTVWSGSSRGPCRDGRIKPNLVAPGQDVSTAYGRDPYGYRTRSGTSLSAPAASGALMLVRQYLTQGWYPTGKPDSAHRLAYLSSALMRALAIASADTNVGVGYPPNKDVGWGRLDVSTILHFPNGSVGLAFLDDTFGLATGQLRTFEFRLDRRSPLIVALTWTDTAAAPAAAVAIVNDLDLELVSPDGNRYRGNQFYAGWSATNPP